MTILVTGASGFVGRALVERLSREPARLVRATVRCPQAAPVPRVEYAVVGNLGPSTDWGAALRGCDVVIHAAARVHVMRDTAADSLAQFRLANVEGTLSLARQAAAAGVKRLVFVSSIKVNGEETAPGAPFQATDEPKPVDPYGRSKLEAESALREVLERAGVEWVIVRPPLIYGPHVKANFLRMMQWLLRGVPLPFGAVENQRSLVALDNLLALLKECSVHPRAAGEVFLAADGEDVSTPELLRRLAAALGTRARLVNVPPGLLTAVGRLTGQKGPVARLIGTLQVDVTKARALLGWKPEITLDEGLAQAAHAFLTTTREQR